MDEMIDEVLRLRAEIDAMWEIIQSRNDPESGIGRSDNSRGARYHSNLEYKLGTSSAGFFKRGWRGAIRPWLDSSKVRRKIIGGLGLDTSGFAGGLIGGLYGTAVTMLLDAIAKFFRKRRSELTRAIEPEQVFNVYPHDLSSSFEKNIESEFYRGRNYRASRDQFLRGESLERQIQRGVVGL